MQRRHGNAADVTEGHIGTTAEVGKLDLQRVHVTSKVDQTGSFGQVVDVDRLEVGVLSDVKVTNLVEGDTVKAGQTSVGDGNVAGLGNTSGELKLLQLGKSLKLDAANAAQRTKVESEETSEAIELEGVADLAEVRGSQGGKVASTGATETTGDLLDVVEGQGVGDVLGDFDITLEGLARAVAVDVTLVGDLDGLAVLTAGCTKNAVRFSFILNKANSVWQAEPATKVTHRNRKQVDPPPGREERTSERPLRYLFILSRKPR